MKTNTSNELSLEEQKQSAGVDIAALKAQVEYYKEIARQHTVMASKGVYYTLEELKEHDSEVARVAYLQCLKDLGRYSDKDKTVPAEDWFNMQAYVKRIKDSRS